MAILALIKVMIKVMLYSCKLFESLLFIIGSKWSGSCSGHCPSYMKCSFDLLRSHFAFKYSGKGLLTLWFKEHLFRRTSLVYIYVCFLCFFFFPKNLNFFASSHQPTPFFWEKLTWTKQLIDCGLKKALSSVYVII